MTKLKHAIYLAALILGTYLVLPVGAQNFVWGSINGVPFGPGVQLGGNLTFTPDDTYDIGASGATRPRTIYTGSHIYAGAGAQIAWTGRTVMQSPSDGVMRLSNNAGTDFTRIQFGDTTSSFPALKRSGTTLQLRLADDSAAGGLGFDALAISGTAPTISSGFGTSPSIVANNGTAAFTINVGTGGSASSGVIGLPTAATGWAVQCMNTSTNTATVFVTKQTATAATTATIGNYDAAGAAAAWVASDVLVCQAMAY